MYAPLHQYVSFSSHKSYVTCNIYGGLGRQMFIIFTTISYAIKHKKTAYFTPKESDIIRNTYWDTFFKGLQSYLSEPRKQLKIYQEPTFCYKAIPPEVDALVGNFQSYRYFEKELPSILKIIGLESYQENIRSRITLAKASISLHFRIGDYVQYKNYHPIQDASYYENALKYMIPRMPEEATVYCFYEVGDKERVMENMKNYSSLFPSTTFVHVPELGLADWEEMVMMSLCNSHIISNSSFSWFGAYLAKSKRVVYPSVWFGPALAHHDTKDLCPPDWIRM